MRTILVGAFDKNSMAAHNRMLGYVKGLVEAGVDARLVIFLTHDAKGLVKPSAYTDYIYFPKPKGKIHRLLSEMRTYRTALRKIIGKGDAVMFYNVRPELMFTFMHKRGITKAIEITEHPEAVRSRKPLNRMLSLFAPYLIRRADALFVISDSLKDYFSQQGIKADRIHRINMFVDPTRFDNIAKDPDAGKYIAYCGSVSMHKDGADDLIKAFAIFSKTHPDYQLHIVGKFLTDNDRTQIQALVDSLGVKDKVVFTGLISAEKMPAELCGAQILALARPNNKQAQFGFPTKLGEYLSTGNPVVVTRVGELDHFLTDNVDCRFARPDDPADFAEKLSWVADHPEEAAKIAHQARQLIETDFSYRTQSALMHQALLAASHR